MKTILAAAAIAAAAALVAPQAYAGSYTIEAVEGVYPGGFDTENFVPNFNSANGIATANFTYTGNLFFNDSQPQNGGPTGDLNSTFGFSETNISGYSGNGIVTAGGMQVANFLGTGPTNSDPSNFLASSGSASGFAYGSWYAIDLGTLAKGTVLDITHDDGVSVWQGSSKASGFTSGATSVVDEKGVLQNTGDTILYYSRQNGTPSILEVAVPEPMTISLLGAGVASLAFLRRRRSAQAQA